MSYSSRLQVVECDARMKAIDVGKARRLLDKQDVGVDSCFLDAMRTAADGAIDEGLTTALIEIPKERCWFSGNHVSEEAMAPLAPMIVGKLSGYFVGEDGSLHGGFVIESGRLQKCHVEVTLTPVSGAVSAREVRGPTVDEGAGASDCG